MIKKKNWREKIFGKKKSKINPKELLAEVSQYGDPKILAQEFHNHRKARLEALNDIEGDVREFLENKYVETTPKLEVLTYGSEGIELRTRGQRLTEIQSGILVDIREDPPLVYTYKRRDTDRLRRGE
jgi:hypothetical protein